MTKLNNALLETTIENMELHPNTYNQTAWTHRLKDKNGDILLDCNTPACLYGWINYTANMNPTLIPVEVAKDLDMRRYLDDSTLIRNVNAMAGFTGTQAIALADGDPFYKSAFADTYPQFPEPNVIPLEVAISVLRNLMKTKRVAWVKAWRNYIKEHRAKK